MHTRIGSIWRKLLGSAPRRICHVCSLRGRHWIAPNALSRVIRGLRLRPCVLSRARPIVSSGRVSASTWPVTKPTRSTDISSITNTPTRPPAVERHGMYVQIGPAQGRPAAGAQNNATHWHAWVLDGAPNRRSVSLPRPAEVSQNVALNARPGYLRGAVRWQDRGHSARRAGFRAHRTGCRESADGRSVERHSGWGGGAASATLMLVMASGVGMVAVSLG
jgi:hypothetical protein